MRQDMNEVHDDDNNNPAGSRKTLARFEAALHAYEDSAGYSARLPPGRFSLFRRLWIWLSKLFSRELHDENLSRELHGANLSLFKALKEVLVVHENQLYSHGKELHAQGCLLSSNEQQRLNTLYADFEDIFRGQSDEIRKRQEIYLPFIKKALADPKQELVLDIGSGRGEWLELLRDNGFRAVGIETNNIVSKACRENGLEVVSRDVLSYLQDTSEESVSAITCFHVAEHLPFPVLVRLLDETVRVLKKGGIAIFETPNPQNILVGANNFYFDPTHRNPIPAQTFKFLAEACGLRQVAINNLHPYPESYRVDGSDLAVRFNEFFYGPQDYALIGYKP